MQSPAPATSLAEPPPAASPQLGRWMCQQGLRSTTIRGLLLALAAASAAAAASTTSALAFSRLVTFRTSMIVLTSYFMCTHGVHGFSYCHVSCLLLHPAMQQECVPWLVLVDLD